MIFFWWGRFNSWT